MAATIKILVLVAVLLLIGLSPGAVQAAPELTVTKNVAYPNFPGSIEFYFTAQSNENIIDIRLCYNVERESFAQVVSEIYIEFEPDITVDVGWTWDLRRTGGLPQGSVIHYWWQVTHGDGSHSETQSQQLVFEDIGHNWQSITEGHLTLYWYEGDDSFAEELMAAAQKALAQLYEDAGAQLKKPVDLYIYANAQELQQALMFPQQWTGGQAFPRYNKIAIGIATYMIDWGKRAIIHELTHLVTHQMTFNPYSNLPTWLNEGLSMYAEGDLEAVYQVYLEQAITQDNLISVRSLASPFSAYAATSYLSYAESHSIVSYLIGEYSQQSMSELLDTFQQGSTADGALLNVYGFDMDTLNKIWRDYIMLPVTTGTGGQVEVNLALIGLLVLVGVALVVSGVWLWRLKR